MGIPEHFIQKNQTGQFYAVVYVQELYMQVSSLSRFSRGMTFSSSLLRHP
jgi:hypothetical protein